MGIASNAADYGNPFTKQFDYDGSGNVIYIGEAYPGTAVTAAKWRIQKFTYSGTNCTKIEWANGTTDFKNIWNNRTTLTYT